MSVVKRLASYAGVDILAALLGLITSPITTRLLSIEQYGVISYIAAIWTPFLIARYGGIDYSFVFFKARKGVDQEQLLASCTKVVGFSIIFVVSVFILFIWASDVLDDQLVIGQYEVALFVLGLMPIAMVDWLLLMFRFAHMASAYAKVAVVQKISVIVVSLLAMYFVEPQDRLLVYFLVAAVFPMLSFVFALKLMKRTSMRPFNRRKSSNNMIKELLSYGAYLVPGGILYGFIAVADKLLVGSMVGMEGVALLALAIALSAPITMLKKWVSLVLNPLIADWIRDMGEAYYTANLNCVLQCLSVIFFPLVLLISIWAGPIVKLLYVENYQDSAIMIPFLAYSGVLATLTLVAISVVLVTQKRSTTLKVNVLALLANLLLSIYLIPHYGPVGAVFGTVLAETIILLLWGYLGAFHYKLLILDWGRIIIVAVIVFFLILYGTFYFLDDATLLVRSIATIMCSMLTFFYYRMNSQNFQKLKKLI